MDIRAWIVLVALALLTGVPAAAQILSPGPLTRAHASLEGLRNCTQCHTLGQRGPDPDRCLTCHTPIRDRLRAREGLHGRENARACGSCHSDHHGRGFDPVRLDTRRFDHARRTGFALAGQHRSATCRSCHRPGFITDATVRRTLGAAGRLSETYLGVADDCATCHRSENPHGTALTRRDCASCHTPSDWNDTDDFDHAVTGTRLTGAHAQASCTGCHGAEGRGAARFRNVPTACASCHASDSPHGTQFRGQSCADCHSTGGWGRAGGFDHSATRFALTGAHARTDCASCHGDGANARFAGTSTSCLSCHADDSPHGAQFAGRECGTCHSAAGFGSVPQFDHARTDFPLVGQHARVACSSCHAADGAGPVPFASVTHASCATCHDDAHDGALGADCATCHSPVGWNRLADTDALGDRFDHAAATGFVLAGAHARAACTSCHGDGGADEGLARNDAAFRIAVASGADGGASFPALDASDGCLSCHADPHDGVMADLPGGTDCAGCHAQEAFVPSSFTRARHDAETPFALTGAHAVVPCGACHTTGEARVPTFGLAPACQSCHADDSPHGTQFASADGVTVCADCHATDGWSSAAFDHAARTGFALTGAHGTAECASCHTRPASGPWSFDGLDATCQSCHDADSALGADAANPHGDQFDDATGRTDCARCHTTDRFRLATFDHDRTRFSLEGAHAAVPCASCHRAETDPDGRTVIRFRPLPTQCADCHTGR